MTRFFVVYDDDVERIIYAPSIDVADRIAAVLRLERVVMVWAD